MPCICSSSVVLELAGVYSWRGLLALDEALHVRIVQRILCNDGHASVHAFFDRLAFATLAIALTPS